MFCGGCSIAHSALLSGKYKYVHINDIEDTPQLFLDAIQGKYKNEKRWISREAFSRLKDTDPYVRYCWSFGTNGQHYLYSKEIEPYKKAYWYAWVLEDFSFFAEFDKELAEGLKVAENKRIFIAKNSEKVKKAYIDWYKRTFFKGKQEEIEFLVNDIENEKERLRQYLIEERNKNGLRSCDVDKFLGTNGMAGHYYGKSQWAFPTQEAYEKLDEIMHWSKGYPITYKLTQSLQRLESLQRLQRLESLERLQRLESLQRLQRLESLQRLQRLESRIIATQGDYRDVKIEANSVIYCDPPYKDTDEYIQNINHDDFYNWVEKQKNIYISEYNMPKERFKQVYSVQKRQLFNGKGAGTLKEESLFIPVSNIEEYENRKKDTLF